MEGFEVGQQIVYPNHGIGIVEGIEDKQIGTNALSFYMLRLAESNSMVMVPVANAMAVGLRSPISANQCEMLFARLADDFEPLESDWKGRFKDFSDRMRTGDIFSIASVLKCLTFLGQVKALSFREQRMFEKARYLVVSELAAVCQKEECHIQERVQTALVLACAAHHASLAENNAQTMANVH